MRGFLHRLFFLDEKKQYEDKDRAEQQGAGDVLSAPIRSLCVLICIDNSGSMQEKDFPPSRIAAARRASVELSEFLLRRSPNSYVGVGTFADEFHLCTNPVPVKDRYEALLAGLGDLGETGSTEMKAGIEGLHGMMRSCPPGMEVRAVLLTDGHNTGPSPVRASQAAREAGMDLWAIGIGARGADVDEKLLLKMVSRPEQYVFIGNYDGPAAIAGAFLRMTGLYHLEE